MEEQYQSSETWIWSKAVHIGKKLLIAGIVVSSAPLLVPSLVVASTIALLSSIPYCLFLANYALTQKIMSSLLPATGGIDKDEYEFEDSKLGHGPGTAEVDESGGPLGAMNDPDDEEMAKESTRLIEKIRDEGRIDRRTSVKELQDDEKSGNAKSEKVQDQPRKQEAPDTGHEGELGGTITQNFTGKDEEKSSNEVYSEEQIWEKMEALRKVVGYSVARSATYAEELKALYVFTGVVEPARSRLMNQDSHDIAHVTLRLRFLMSSIGIN